ncbi:hypothetical protein D3C85_1204430 [compost metagenome]
MADQVQFKVGDLQAGLCQGHAVTPQQHLDAGGHFIGGERFGQVVITAGAQAADPFVDIRQGADHQDWRGDLQGAQGRDDGQAVDLREHPVQGDQVVAAGNGLGQAFTAVVGPFHFQAMAGKFGDDFLGGDSVVFDSQYAGHAFTWAAGRDLIVPKNRRCPG